MRLYLDAAPVVYTAVIDKATEIRAVHSFHAADAIHLGAAVIASCDVFLTNDHRLDRFTELAVEVVQPQT